MKLKCIAIVGLGLMGASLAAAIRKKLPSVRVVGISRNPKALALVRRRGWAHEVTKAVPDGVRNADLVILCTPVDTLRSLLLKVDQTARFGTVVTDIGSVKGDIVGWSDKRRFKRIRFVGAHPMAGSHAKGAFAAQPNLYEKSFVFMVKSPRTNSAAFQAVRKFWCQFCAQTFEINAGLHDRIVAEISHLPHAVAACLVQSVTASSVRFAASGFSDATRIAQGHPSIWLPIFMTNRKNIFSALKRFEKSIRSFKKALKDKDGRVLGKILFEASKKRGQISL